MVLALIYGVILAFIIQHLDRTWAIIAGALFGLALYGINFYGFTATYPWFADARGYVSLFTHVVQSGLMAYIYKVMERPAAA